MGGRAEGWITLVGLGTYEKYDAAARSYDSLPNDRIVIPAMESYDYVFRASCVYSYLRLTNVLWAEHVARRSTMNASWHVYLEVPPSKYINYYNHYYCIQLHTRVLEYEDTNRGYTNHTLGFVATTVGVFT